MILLEQNLLKLNNGQFAKFSHLDDWHRMIFIFDDGKKYCLLDGQEFYTVTPMGEPDCPLKIEFQPKNIKIFDPADRDTQDVISLEDWEDYFEPVMIEYEGEQQFDSYQEACDFCASRYCRKQYQHIWSIVDGDSGKLIVLNGYHKVNVLHYVVCDIPWGFGTDSDKDVYLEVKYEE